MNLDEWRDEINSHPVDQLVCMHCRVAVENRSEPSMSGPPRPHWVHVPGGYSVCDPQNPLTTRATPMWVGNITEKKDDDTP